jgi:hypothetical protein
VEHVQSKVEGLLAEPAGDDLVVYDPDIGSAHVLNPLAAAIWSRARAGVAFDVLASEFQPTGGLDEIRVAVAELDSAGLLVASTSAANAGISRRALLRRVGLAAVAAPFVTTILTASPAAAVPGATCSASIPCVGTNPENNQAEVCDGGRCARPCSNNGDCDSVSGCTCQQQTSPSTPGKVCKSSTGSYC